MDRNQENAPDASQGLYPAAMNHPYQPGRKTYMYQQGQSYMYGTQGQPYMYGTQGAYSGGANVPMMHPNANGPETFQPIHGAFQPVQQPEASHGAFQPVQQPQASHANYDPDVVELSDPPAAARAAKASRTKLSNFSSAEDVHLVKSWLEISTDPIIGNGQKKEKLWQRIFDRYHARIGAGPQRTIRSLQSRWDIIKAEVGKFSSFYADAVRDNHSGTTDADKTTQAASNFAGSLKHPFALMHCWGIMKDQPKWQDPKSRASAKSRFGEASNQAEGNCSPPASERPIGRDSAKAAKKKANSSAGSASSAEYASKMQDLTLFMQEESVKKHDRHLQLATIEEQRFDELRRHNQSLLAIEQDKIQLMREKHELEKEEKEIQKEERILAIDLNKCLPHQRQYYELMQQQILAKQTARLGKRQAPDA